jgi:hypothetical protein
LQHKSRISLTDAHAFFLLPSIDVSAAAVSAPATSYDAAAVTAGGSAHAPAVSNAPPMASFGSAGTCAGQMEDNRQRPANCRILSNHSCIFHPKKLEKFYGSSIVDIFSRFQEE